MQVQAYRRDTSKPQQHQYSPPMPEDPWYTAYNLYAEKKGRSRPDEIIVVLAHKDSQSWIDSPGANDNAIGTVGVLELACVLAKYPVRADDPVPVLQRRTHALDQRDRGAERQGTRRQHRGRLQPGRHRRQDGGADRGRQEDQRDRRTPSPPASGWRS